MLKTSIAILTLTLSQLAFAGGDLYPTAECMLKLEQDARLRPLAGKVALGLGDETTSAQVALDRLPAAEERNALNVWSELRRECFALGTAHRAAAHAGLPGLTDRMFAAQQLLLRELQEGRIGFAEFNASRFELWKVERRQQANLLRPEILHSAAAALR
jgi:hypothetical protein